MPCVTNLRARKALKRVLSGYRTLKKDFNNKLYAASERRLINDFNNTYTTPLALIIPPSSGSIAAIREELLCWQVQIINSGAESIIVEEMKQIKIGTKQKTFRFVFENGEWICGNKVLSF